MASNDLKRRMYAFFATCVIFGGPLRVRWNIEEKIGAQNLTMTDLGSRVLGLADRGRWCAANHEERQTSRHRTGLAGELYHGSPPFQRVAATCLQENWICFTVLQHFHDVQSGEGAKSSPQ